MPPPKKVATTTTTELNLLATVLANPTDAVALEVYADYLQEQGAARAADETRVRSEAQAIRDGTYPKYPRGLTSLRRRDMLVAASISMRSAS